MAEKKTEAVKVSRFSGLKARSLGPLEGAEGAKAFAESRQIRDPFSKKAYGVFRLAEPVLGRKSLERFADLLLENTDFATCCAQIAIDVTGLGYHFLPIKKQWKDEKTEDELRIFFDTCNPDMSFDDIAYNVNLDWESLGNGYIEVTRAGNMPKAKVERLDHIPGKEVRLTKDLKNFVQIRDGRQAWFRRFGSDPDAETSKDEKTGEVLNEVIWFSHYHPADRHYGIPRVVPALGAVRGNQFQQDRNLQFFYNKSIPEWVLQIKGDFSGMGPEEEAELEEFKAEIENHFEMILRGQHFRLLQIEVPQGVELDWQKVGVENKDGDFRKYYKDNRDETIRSYSMLPHRIGIIEAGNIGGGTGETQIETYKHSVVKPRQEKWERKMLRLIQVGLFIETYKMKFDEIDTIDEAREAEILGILARTAYLTINEGREYISMFLKKSLDKIDADWADYPFQIIATQLAMMNLGVSGKAELPAGLFTGDMPSVKELLEASGDQGGALRIYRKMKELGGGK